MFILAIALAIVLTVSARLAVEVRPTRSVRQARSSWELAVSTSGSHQLI